MEVLAEYSLDLFALLPLGELWVAAARLQQLDQLRQPLAEAFGLPRAAGNPALWAVPLHWAGVHAGILANAPEAVAPHGQALSAASRAEGAHGAYATALPPPAAPGCGSWPTASTPPRSRRPPAGWPASG